MGRKRAMGMHGERVVHTGTGETGTIVDTHTDAADKRKRYGVLRDTGRRMLVVWLVDETEYSAPVRDCKRCGETGHTALNCDKGDRP